MRGPHLRKLAALIRSLPPSHIAYTPLVTMAQPSPPPGLAQDWEATWREGVKPGTRWDISGSYKPLLQLVREGRVPLGRALVPGCGRGWDVLTLAQPGRTVVGLEIAPTAAREARELFAAAPPEQGANATVEEGDFFALEGRQFDVIFDYTMLCATLPARCARGGEPSGVRLNYMHASPSAPACVAGRARNNLALNRRPRPTLPHPRRRAEWAAQMRRLLAPGGLLVCGAFPLKPWPAGSPEDPARGPPFQLSRALYHELLAPTGLVCEEDRELGDGESFPARAGYEAVLLWRAPPQQ